jgi:hypothetical protein
VSSRGALLTAFVVVMITITVRSAPGTKRGDGETLAQVNRAIDLSARYLESACGETGRFAYRLDPNSGRQVSSYNIVRHAGAIYALAMLNRAHPDRKAVEAAVRAAAFLRANYIGTEAHSGALAVWSRPKSMASEASLGAAGLGLAALAEVDQAQPNSVPVSELEGIGRFIVFLQRRDGSFASKYRPLSGAVEDWESLYYPGEAALGLVALYEIGTRRLTERFPIYPTASSNPNTICPWSTSRLRGRPPFAGVNRRLRSCSRPTTKPGSRSGRPVWVAERMVSASASASPVRRKARHWACVQWLRHSSRSSGVVTPLLPQCTAALDHSNCSGSETMPARTGFRSV